MKDVYLRWARQHFERCKPWIEAALAQQPLPSHDLDSVWQAIESGHCVMWPTDNSVAIVEIIEHPTGLKTLNGWLVGGDLKELKRTEEIVAEYGRKNGFSAMTVWGREGWGRALGYQRAAALFVKELN